MHVLSVSHRDKVEKVVLAPGVSPREVANCLGETVDREVDCCPRASENTQDRLRFSARFGASRSRAVIETVEALFLKLLVRFVAGRGR